MRFLISAIISSSVISLLVFIMFFVCLFSSELDLIVVRSISLVEICGILYFFMMN